MLGSQEIPTVHVPHKKIKQITKIFTALSRCHLIPFHPKTLVLFYDIASEAELG